MIRTLSLILMILAVFILSAGPVTAQETDPAAMAEPAAIGTILEVEGEGNLLMRAAEGGKAYPARIDDAVYLNDIIQTGAGGKILVVLIDDSRFTLGENAQLKVDEYIYDNTSDASNKSRYSVLRGVFLYTSGLIAKKPNPDVKISTSHGSIGIRGTTIWSGMVDDQYGIFVDDGEIAVETNRGRIRVMAGEGTTIRGLNSIPERAKKWSPEKIARVKTMISLKNPAAVKERMALNKQKQAVFIERHKDFIRARNQNRIQQQNPRDSIKRLDNRPAVIRKENGEAPGMNPNPMKEKIIEKREERKEMIEEKMEERKENADQPEFPRPAPALQPNPENLPADPARRQEELEKLNLKKGEPVRAKPKHDPL